MNFWVKCVWRRHLRVACFFLGCLLCSAALLTCWHGFRTVSAYSGTITGTVFLDYNSNGVMDAATTETNTGNGTVTQATDTGIGSVTVTAYDAAGAVVGTATSASSGTYSLAASGTGPYRIEFTDLPAGYTPSSVPASGSGPTVQFVNDGNTSGVNLGLVYAADYSQNSPDLFTNCYVVGASNGANSNEPVLISVGYKDGATVSSTNAQYDSPSSHLTKIKQGQVGTTWGLAYRRATKRLYAGAFFKRHSGFGPGADGAVNTTDDPGAVYVTNPAQNTVESVITIPNATTNSHNTANYSTDNGNTGWDAVGKTSLGGLAISDDETLLYVMNLQNRTLYALNVPAGTVAASQATPTSLPGCPAASDARPFAVTFYRNQLYVGMVCSAESTNTATDLRAYVYTANPTTLTFGTTPVVNTPLNYTRGNLNEFTTPALSANWRPWRPTFTSLAEVTLGSFPNFVYETGYPQPMLTSIEFDIAGNIYLALRDRAGDQFGYQQEDNPASAGKLYLGDAAGDLLLACGNPTSGWTLESNGACGGSSSSGAGNNQGLGGGEFFFRDEWKSSTIAPVNTLGHDEVVVGGLAQIPGFPDLLSTVFDPIPLVTDGSTDDAAFSGGLRWFNKANGAVNKAARIYANTTAITFGKANGLGDLGPQRNAAPLQLGNRVWTDANANGVQDPGETGLANVSVQLWADTDSNGSVDTQIGTATTDANGNYYFGGANNANLLVSSCPTTITSRVAASTDDATERYDTTVVGTNNAGAGLRTGQDSLGVERMIGMRFAGIFIPQGATITSATLQFTAFANGSGGTSSFTIRGEKNANAATFSATNTNLSNTTARPRTTAAVGWTGIGNWTTGTTTNATTPDIASVIQEIVNQTGWNSGQALNLFVESNTATNTALRTATSFDDNANSAPLLTVTYSFCTYTVNPNTAYEIRLPNASGGSKQAALGANNLVTANTDTSTNGVARDSDAVLASTTGVIALTTSAAGANNHTYDFGFTAVTATFAVGNRVWYDTDNNGVMDAGEVGIANVTVDLLDSGGTQIQTTTTDSSGYYRFDGVASGTGYRIRVRSTNFSGALSGYQNTTGATSVTDQRDNGVDPAANNPTLNHVLSNSFTLGFTQPQSEIDVTTGSPAADKGAHSASGDVTDNLTVDFGFYRTQIGNLIFLDNNNDGDYDSGTDAGLAGAEVTIYQSDGTTQVLVGADGILGTADDGTAPFTTTSSGAYLFQGLPPGSYVLKVTPPIGYKSTVDTANSGTPNSGTDNDDNGIGTATTQVTSGLLTLTAGSTANGASVTNSSGLTANPTTDFGFAPSAPSAVRMVEFTAARDTQNGVTLQWSTGYEVDNLGFNVYRDEHGQRVLLNPALIAGSALQVGQGTQLTSGTNYEWTDARGAAGQMYWLEDIDLDGQRNWHGPIFASGQSANRFGRASAGRTVLLDELSATTDTFAQHEYAESDSFAEATEALPSSAFTLARANAPAWTLPNQRAVKISIRQTGWYRIKAAELTALGFDINVNPNALSLTAEGKPVAFKLVKTKANIEALEFYGGGLDVPSTDERIYWLSASNGNGLTLGSSSGRQPAQASVSNFITTVERKERSIYFSSLLNEEKENWFGAVVSPASATQKLTARALDAQVTGNAELEIKLQGVTNQAHQVKVEINGQLAGSMVFIAKENVSQKFLIPSQWLREGDNEIRLTGVMGNADYSLVDCLRLRYARKYQADNDALNFTLADGQTALVTGFTSPNVRLLQLSATPREVEIKTQPQPGGGYGFTLTGNGGGYLALADSKLARPANLKLDQPSHWRGFAKAADFLIVTHQQFKASAEQLAQARAAQGWLPVVVDVEDVYDEFAFGAHTPQAVRDLIAHAQTSWASKLKAVLLIGAGHYDPRNYAGSGAVDFVPIKLSDTTLLESASENWFTDLDNDGMSDLPLGRLPVRSAEQAAAVIAKLVSVKPEPAWRSALLVSDQLTDGVDFPAMSQQIAANLPTGMARQFIKRADGTPDQIRDAIVTSLNQNKPQVVNWSGHGSTDRWTSADLLRLQDAVTLTNGAPSVWVMMTCLNGYFISPTQTSLSQAILLNPTGGGTAVVASSTMSVPAPQLTLNQVFYRNLFTPNTTVGEAFQAAKLASGHWEVRKTYVLLGDPTMRLNLKP